MKSLVQGLRGDGFGLRREARFGGSAQSWPKHGKELRAARKPAQLVQACLASPSLPSRPSHSLNEPHCHRLQSLRPEPTTP